LDQQEVQWVSLWKLDRSGAPGGTFTLSLASGTGAYKTTAAISVGATGAAVLAAMTSAGLAPLPTTVDDPVNGAYKFTWTAGAGNVNTLVADATFLTPASGNSQAQITLATARNGGAEAAGPATSGDNWTGTGSHILSGGGLYCGSCHTPHGEFGQLVNSTFYRADVFAPTKNEVQTVKIGGMSGSTSWRLTFVAEDGNTWTTAYMTSSQDAATVQSRLGALPPLAGNVGVTRAGAGTSADPYVYTVTFNGALAGTNVQQMTSSLKSGGTGTAVVTTGTNGDTFDGTLNKVHSVQEGAAVALGGATTSYLHLDTSADNTGAAAWESCARDTTDTNVTVIQNATAPDQFYVTSLGAATASTCSFLTAADAEGQTVSLYGYKLLSAYPNHSWDQGPESYGMAQRSRDSARWCGRCHNQAVDTMFGGTFHAHPTGCTSCHGNPNDMSSFDFPHTSTSKTFLKDYPDALCINCHTAGSLV
jgi:hypothetical protein